jgi:hypothetical protein
VRARGRSAGIDPTVVASRREPGALSRMVLWSEDIRGLSGRVRQDHKLHVAVRMTGAAILNLGDLLAGCMVEVGSFALLDGHIRWGALDVVAQIRRPSMPCLFSLSPASQLPLAAPSRIGIGRRSLRA